MNILVVDDENMIIQGLASIISGFKAVPCTVKGADNVFTALNLLEEFKPELIITDINMPVMNGFDFMRQAVQRNPGAKFVILTGYDEFDYARQAIRFKAEDFLLKPVDREELFNVIQKVHGELAGKSAQKDALPEGMEYLHLEIDRQKLSYHLVKILDYIDNNYNKNISLIHLSDYSGMNANYICMLFKKELQISYLNYLDIVRLKKAAYFLIHEHRKNIMDIARMIGYQTERQFFKMFKKKTGITPNQFREMHGNARIADIS